MQHTTLSGRKPAQSIGEQISMDYFQFLVDGYKTKHPTEQQSVFIPKELIVKTLDQFPNVSGLRFMYGLKEGAAPSSRTIVLMACNDTSTEKEVPNLIFASKGYLTNEGERISIDQCWDLFARYVNRMCELMPEEKRKDIPRACFYGINTLKELLSPENCAGMLYHFGYNTSTAFLPQRYEAPILAVDSYHISLGILPVEMGQICPTMCAPGYPNPPAFANLSRSGTDTKVLYEMYHYVSPSLIEALQRSGIPEKDHQQYYSTQFAECISLFGSGKANEAIIVFKDKLDELMAKYLYAN